MLWLLLVSGVSCTCCWNEFFFKEWLLESLHRSHISTTYPNVGVLQNCSLSWSFIDPLCVGHICLRNSCRWPTDMSVLELSVTLDCLNIQYILAKYFTVSFLKDIFENIDNENRDAKRVSNIRCSKLKPRTDFYNWLIASSSSRSGYSCKPRRYKRPIVHDVTCRHIKPFICYCDYLLWARVV